MGTSRRSEILSFTTDAVICEPHSFSPNVRMCTIDLHIWFFLKPQWNVSGKCLADHQNVPNKLFLLAFLTITDFWLWSDAQKKGRIYTNVFNSIFNIKHSSSNTNNHIRVLFLLKIKHETIIITLFYIYNNKVIHMQYSWHLYCLFCKRPQFPFFSYLNSSACVIAIKYLTSQTSQMSTRKLFHNLHNMEQLQDLLSCGYSSM